MFNKVLSLGLLAALSLNLSGCLASIDEDASQQVTQYGTLYLGKGAQGDADKLTRDVVTFSGSATFVAGYVLKDNRVGNELVHTLYRQSGVSFAPDEWAKTLERSAKDKDDWEIVRANASESQYDTIYQVTNLNCTTACEPIRVALSVSYLQEEELYALYLAIPSSAMVAAKVQDIHDRFTAYHSKP